MQSIISKKFISIRALWYMYLNVYQSDTTNFIFIKLVVSDCLLNVVLYAFYDEKKIKYWI